MCCSGNYKVSAKTQENTIRLVVKLCKVLGIDSKDVDTYILRHYDVTHKSCPAQWADDDSEFITFKNKVKSLLSGASTSPSISVSKTFKVGDTVKIISGAKYTNGKLIPKWIAEKTLYIRQIKGNNAVISTLKTGAVTGIVNLDYLVKDGVVSNSISSYRIRVATDKLNIRKGAGTNYPVIGTITDKGVYTIVEEATGQGATSWLKLKSGGYISADYVKKI
jgi:N-acetylmuramoyl-L-alanine amidase CwlA